MHTDRFQRVMDAFEQATNRPAPQRSEFLRNLLVDDPAALAEVEELLAHHDRNSGAVATGVGLDAAGAAIASPDPAAAMPRLRGDYRILRTIGEGGMGVVFEAEQDFPRRRVALKSLRPGFASERMLRRFRNEADFLARLQHPNIAQIYEAGVADDQFPDQAYFVMELVQGLPLTEYAATHALDQRQRWEILAVICDAVQHAHQRGIIHRDLKPANLLVSADGTPKVVDFGIARAAEADAARTVATREGQLIGTPSYMSPEQLTGGEVDTRSDIYALGVIAYELLSGVLPFDLSSVSIIRAAKIVSEEEPPPLSARHRSLRGDAEVIVAKAMAKEPQRRYASAAEFSQDIRRLLAGDAIMARRDSALYVVGKQVRRHRTAASVAFLAIASLLAFAIFASINASRQRLLAEATNKARLEAVAAKETADAAKTDADIARRRALDELVQATVERGRMAAAVGNLPLAEDILWPVYLDRPDSPAAHWALWRTYDHNPSEWVRQTAGDIRVATISDQAGRVALIGVDGALVLFDGQTGQPLTAPTLPDPASAIALWPDGSRLVVASAKGGLRVVPLDGTSQPTTVVGPDPKISVAQIHVSGDARTICDRAADGVVRVWDVPSGSLRATFTPGRNILTSVLSPDGARLAVSTYVSEQPGLGIWDTATGQRVSDLTGAITASSNSLLFSQDGRALYIGTRPGIIHAWNTTTNSLLFSAPIAGGPITSLAPSADGAKLLAASRWRLHLVSAKTGERLHDVPMERFQVAAVAPIERDDFAVITDEGLLRRLNTHTDASATLLGDYPGWSFSVAYSPDGARLAVGTGTSVIDVYDDRTHALLSRHTIAVPNIRTRGLEFAPDGASLVAASADGLVRLLDPASGSLVKTLYSRRAEPFALDINSRGDLVAVGYADRRTILISLPDGQVTELPPFGKRIEGLAFSPDGSLLAISSHYDGVVLWDTASATQRAKLPTSSSPWGVAFSPDGKRLYSSNQAGGIDAFDIATGARTASPGHQRLAPGLAVSPDGRLIATGGEEGAIRLWDAATLRTVAEFNPNDSTIVGMAFSPDSSRLAATTAFRVVVEYDLRSSDHRIRAHEPFFRAKLGKPAG